MADDNNSDIRWPVPFTDAVRALLHSTRAPLLRSHPSGDTRTPGCEYACWWRPGKPCPTLLRCGTPGGQSRWAVWYDLKNEVWCWGVGPDNTPYSTRWSTLLSVEVNQDDAGTTSNILPPLGRAWRKKGDRFGESLDGAPSTMRFSVVEESVAMTHWWTRNLHVKMPAEVRRAVRTDQTTLPIEMWCMVLNHLRGGSMLASRPAPTPSVEECWPAGAIRAPQDFSVVDAAHAVLGAPAADKGDVVIKVTSGRSVSLPVATQLDSLIGHVTRAPDFAFPDGLTDLEQCMLLLVSPAEALQVEYTEWVWRCKERESDAVNFNRAKDGAELEAGASRNPDGFFGEGGPPQQPTWWYLRDDAPFLPREYTVLDDDPCPTQWYRLAIPMSQLGRSLADCRIPSGATVSLVPAAHVLTTELVTLQEEFEDRLLPAMSFEINVTINPERSLSTLLWWYAHCARLPYGRFIWCPQNFDMVDRLPNLLLIRKSMKGDIGVLGEHPGAIGADFLRQGQHVNATATDSIKIADSLDATLGTPFFSFPDVLPSEKSRRDLMALADSRHLTETDFKTSLTLHALESVVGRAVLAAALRLFNSRVDKIIVRRVEPVETGTSEIIAFHTDHAAKTMQIPLNDEDDYDGGRITFVTQNGLIQPRRTPGSAIIHDYRIPHGVTAQTAGVRYGLFFLAHFEQIANP